MENQEDALNTLYQLEGVAPLKEPIALADGQHSIAAIQEWLVAELAERLRIEPGKIDIREPIADHGLSSREGVLLSGDLETLLGRELSPTILWEYPSIEALTHYLVKGLDTAIAPMPIDSGAEREPIAIIGLGCRFPGARDPDAYWQLLQDGVNAITEVPSQRWDATLLPKSTRSGGFLEAPDLFDAQFFSISPREAVSMDPQQRLLLEVAWEALENAGQMSERLDSSQTGVFIGISNADYARSQFNELAHSDMYAATGNAFSIAANRISFLLDLKGPSLAIDTACSSSLVAIHLACQSLHSGESAMALAGGVNLILSPEISSTLSQAHMLSESGACKTFDEAADGYVRGEGCGIIVLKRLSDALKDGDRVLALIRGSAVDQDGRSNGLTAPNGLAQQMVIRQALANAHVSANQISYVEAHGTGTPLGDPIELQALAAVLQEGRLENQRCLVGSVKTNIGHLEAAAGIAGLIKVVLSLQHRAIPAHLHLHQVNQHIPLESYPLSIPTQLCPWTSEKETRFAGISSFGFGGTNAHIVLQEAPLPVEHLPALERPLHILTLSGRSEQALKNLATRYMDHLQTHTEQSIQDICFTAHTGRFHLPHRLAITAHTTQELSHSLHAFSAGKTSAEVRQNHIQSRSGFKLAFLFTGQGSQYVGMGRQLYETQPVFRAVLDQCAELLEPYLKQSLLSVLYPTPGTVSPLDETAYTQPALFALEYALTAVWRSWGIEPDAVMGHSLGEYVAACVAGVFSLEDGLKLVAERGKIMQALPQHGQMAVVLAAEAQIQHLLTPYQQDISIAAFNGPRNTVISGTTEAVQTVSHLLEAEGLVVKQLQVSHAFHSPLMEPLLDDFMQAMQSVHFYEARVPFVSNLTGHLIEKDTISHPSYWIRHMRDTVLFAEGMSTLAAYGCSAFVEIGPHPSLLTMAKRCLPDEGLLWLPSLQRKQSDWQVVTESLKTLYLAGKPIDWHGFDQEYQRHLVPLPTYPFERKHYWVKTAETSYSGKAASQQDNLHLAVVKGAFTSFKEQDANSNGERAGIIMPQQTVSRTSGSVRKATIQSQLCGIMGALLQISPDAIDVHMPFLEMGADSLILIEAVRVIEKTFGISLSIRQMFEEFTTFEALAAHIEQHLPPTTHLEVEEEVLAPLQQPIVTPFPVEPMQVQERKNGFREVSTSAPETELSRIMSQQLSVLSHIMSQQLAALRPRESAHPVEPAQQEHPRTSVMPSTQNQSATPPEIFTKEVKAVDAVNKPYSAHQSMQSKATSGLSGRQQRHLEMLILRYTKRTEQSKHLAQAYRSVLSDNRASAGFRFSVKEMLYPIIAAHSMGSKFSDIDNNEYIDVSMGFGVNLFGHGAPFVTEALLEQIKQGIQLGPQTKLAGEVATLIHELTGMERVAFCNSGTEAVMTALRLARATTGRSKIVLFAGSYHGTFDGVLGLPQADKNDLSVLPMAPGIPAHMLEDVLILDYGSPQSLEIIKAQAHELAAVLVEPVQSRHPSLQPGAFLQQLRQLTHDAGVALIFDEVITGFRILPGGAQAWFGIKADLAIYGKIVGGGMPIGVVAGTTAYMDRVDGGMWNYADASYPEVETTFFAGTFSKHPLAMSAARAVLKHIKSNGSALYEQLNERTARFVEKLNTFFRNENVPIHIVHFGSLFRFEFSGNMDLLFYHLLEKGIYIWEGRNCFLSTAHTEEDITSIIQAVQESIYALRDGGFLPELPPATHSADHTTVDSSSANSSLIPAFEGVQRIPLTEAQRQLWTLAQMTEEGSRAYNETVILELQGAFRADLSKMTPASERTGTLQVEILRHAFQTVIQRHEALRTAISRDGASQEILPGVSLNIPLLDFSQSGTAASAEQITQWLQKENQTCFDFTQAPLLRVSILKLEEQRHIVVLTVHHIITDGWSAGVLLQEVGAFYAAECQGQSWHREAPLQFRQYIEWQEQQRESEGMRADERYWLEKFHGIQPVLELPCDHPRPPVKTYNGARQRLMLAADLYTSVKKVGREQGCTTFMTFLTAYMALLHRLTGQNEIVLGIPVAGRSLAGSEELIGYCANIVPIGSSVASNPFFRDHLISIKRDLLDAYEHQDYSFARFIKTVHLPHDASRAPFISTTFNMDRPIAVPTLCDLVVTLVPSPTGGAKFDISLSMNEIEGKLFVDIDYNTDLFEDATIQRIWGYFSTLLANIVRHPELRLLDLPLLTEEELGRLTDRQNKGEERFSREACIHELFEAQVERSPDAVAIVCAQQQMTYRELNQRANQMGHYLTKLGIGPEIRVGIATERAPEMIIGVLAILKAGGAYVPLDLTYPQERLAFLIEDAHIAVVVTQKHLLAQLAAPGVQKVCLDMEERDMLGKESQENLSSGVVVGNAAYLIYTSGSTGQSKGVLVEHKGLGNLVEAQTQAFAMQAESRVLQFAALSFDASVSEIFTSLLAGATLYIEVRDNRLPGPELIQALQNQAITIATLPPTVLAQLPMADLPSLETIIAAGETCSADIVARWAPGRRFLNAYGPTEASVCATLGVCSDGSQKPSIGSPIANVEVYILDRHLQVAPIGVTGEVYIAGVGLARCYLNLPDLTAERFLPHPFHPTGARLYRTGDLGRLHPDGRIELFGRVDQQVKIRGFRIELEEIEATLKRHQAVVEAIVMAREDTPGQKRLVAYIVPLQTAIPTVRELRSFLRERLPDYMLPSVMVMLELFPLTSSGKVDRKQLPAPDRNKREQVEDYVAQRNPREDMLVGIWTQVLGVNTVGVYDNFFEAGGDSILAIQVVARANERGLRFTSKQLFQYPTIAELAAVVDTTPAIQAEQAPVTGSIPLTPIQQWFFDLRIPDVQHWNQALLLEVEQGFEPDILKKSLQHVLLHHDALRLRFTLSEHHWQQACADVDEILPFTCIDLSTLSRVEQKRELESRAAEVQRSLNVAEGPLLRVVFFHLGTQELGRLLLVIHHLAVDAVSWNILLHDLQLVYRQLSLNEKPQLPAKTTSFKQWANRLSIYAQSEKLQQEVAYWQQEVQNHLTLLPLDNNEGKNTLASARTISTLLGVEETQALLQEVPMLYHTQINDVLLTALVAAFMKWTGERSLLVNLEGHGRESLFDDVDMSRTVGWFTSVFPVHLCLEAGNDLGEGLKSIKEHLRSIPNRGIGYGLLRYLSAGAEVHKQLETLPQAQVSFNYVGQIDQNLFLPESHLLALARENCGPVCGDRGDRSYILEINASITRRCLQIDWTYSEHLHLERTIEQLAQSYLDALQAIIAQCLSPALSTNYTPSDFPEAQLDRTELDLLLSEFSE